MAGKGFGASPSTPSVRSWRTAFLTLRDETLTTPTRTSFAQLLQNLIFSHSHTLMSAVTELPSHEVLSDILLIMELVATTSCEEENMVDTVTQTSRMICDISRRVPLEINSSSLTHVLECFGKMLDTSLGKAASLNELTGLRSTTRMMPAIECLQAVRCITSFHGRYSQSGDLLLVEFLLNVIVSSHSTCKDQSLTEMAKKLSMDSSSWELQEAAYSMLGEAISRAGSSFPVHIWRSMIEVVRKTMDGLASKSPILEGNVMSRFYESVLHCLHLILTNSKCSVSDHLSVFVAVLQLFFTYGLTSRKPHTLLIGCEQKEPNTRSPKASWEHANKSDHGPYRPPHLRKKDHSNLEHHGAWHSEHISDSESSAANSISSDSDLSDIDGSVKDSNSLLNSKVRVAAIICIQDLCQADYKSFSMQWSLLLPTSDVLQPRKCDATLMTCLLFDPYLKVRLASATALATLLDGPASIFMQVAEYKEFSKCGSFTALSTSFGQILLQLHRGILYLIQQEIHSRLLALLFKILRLVISSTPYSRMPPDLLPMVISALRRRIEEGFQFKSDQTVLLAAAFGCLTSALSTSPSSSHVSKMLFEEVSADFVEAERKSGVLFILFEYSGNWGCPTICLEALQALRAVFHNYPNIVIACWEQVSAAVYGFLTVVFRETPSRKPCEYVGSNSTSVEEKVLTAAIRVLDVCLRVVSGFQGTEDLSDDKFLDIPFASDCIRMKKVSSAPSYEPESSIVSPKECESGIHQWFETIEKLMPLILWHSSAMVRAASVTCFAGMTSAVFVSFTEEKQDFITSSLIDAAVKDDVPSVRSAACRAIGVISCFPQVCQSAEILDRFAHAVEINTHDSLLSVRITASWALANICDAIRHCVNDLPLECTGSSSNSLMVVWLSECALHLIKDGDKVKANVVRALGYLSRIFKCTISSKSQDMSVDEHPMFRQGYKSHSCQLFSLDESHMLERMVQAFISCVTTGNVKVQWNVCHAFGNLFLNEMLRLRDMDWAPFVFGILLQLLRDSSNYKIRIQAAAALAVPMSVLDYGLSFSDVVQGVEHAMENLGVDQIQTASSFKYRVALQKQLTLTLLHVLSFSFSTSHDSLKDFLVKKSSFLEDWFKALCSPVQEAKWLGTQDKFIEDRKKVMVFRAIKSLIDVYKEKHLAISIEFKKLLET